MNTEKKVELTAARFHITESFEYPYCTFCGLQIRWMNQQASALNIHTW